MTIQSSAPSRRSRGAPLSDPFAAPADPAAVGAAVDIASLTPAFLRLVEETVAQVEACPPRPDVTFDGYESLIAAIRSATTLEGTLLEKGIALVAAASPDLVLIGLERPLPVHEAARAVFRRNDWAKASGLRLDSEIATREHYMPDLLIVDGARNLALIVDVKGTPFAVFFGFTHCPEVCPTTLWEMSEALATLGEDADNLKVFFVSVDPERDTPELLALYLQSFDPRIVGLTGSEEDIRAVGQQYRAYWRTVPLEGGDYTIDHTASIFLMDGVGEFIGTISYGEAMEERLEKLRKLISAKAA